MGVALSPCLPPELWLEIFSYLETRELAAAVQVSKQWTQLCRLPHLWSRVRISKRKLVREGFHKLFSISRYSQVRRLDYSRAWLSRQQWRELLAQVVNCEQVEELDLSQARLDDVETELIGEAMTRVTRVRLCNVQGLDLPRLLSLACGPKSRLRHLHMEELCQLTNITLEQIEPLVLAKTLSTLESVDLGQASQLTRDQMEALVVFCSQTGTKLGADMSTEEGAALPMILPRMSRAHVQVGSSWHQAPWLWHTLLSSLAHPSSTLSHLDLEAVSVSLVGVEPQLIARAFSRLTSLRLSGIQLSPQQWTALLQALPSSPVTSLSQRMVGLASLPPLVLARGLEGLTSLSLQFAAVSPAQWEILLPALAASTTLTSLALVQGDLSCVPAALLPPLARRLRHLDLSDSRLTTQHLQLLLSALPHSSLRSVGLAGLDFRQVGRDCLARGLVSLYRVGLRKARLGEEQIRAILSCSLGPSRLRQVDLSGVNLSAVPTDLLALAISRLREADLACTWLTKAQLNAIVDQVERFTRLEHLRLQAATVALLTREMRKRLEQELYLSVF